MVPLPAIFNSVASSSRIDTDGAIQEAQHTFESGVWSRAPALQRSRVLANLARALEERVPAFARLESLQTGRAIREMNAQLGRLPEWLYVPDIGYKRPVLHCSDVESAEITTLLSSGLIKLLLLLRKDSYLTMLRGFL